MPRGPNSQPSALTRAAAGILYDAYLDMLITQAEFGQLVGMSQQTVSATLRGERVPDLGQFVQMCHAVKLRASDVLATAEDIAG